MSARQVARTFLRGLGAVIAVSLLLALAAASAALAQAPRWSLDSTPAPTRLPRSGEAQIVVSARNLGDAPLIASKEAPVTFKDILPADVKPLQPVEAEASRGVPGHGSGVTPLTGCKYTPLEGGRTEVSCEFENTLLEYESLIMRIPVQMEEPLESPQPLNEVTVEGANAERASIAKAMDVDGGETAFGVETFAVTPEAQAGAADTQAGSHPSQLTTTLDFNQTLATYKTGIEKGPYPGAPALPRNLHFNLPPGLIGDPDAVARCPQADFEAITPAEATNLCPANTAVGVAALVVNDPTPLGFVPFTVPVFNLEPDEGEPARLGFEFQGVPVVLRTSVPAGGEYGVEVTVEDASQAAQVLSGQVILWGDPGDPSHDGARGWECLAAGTFVEKAEFSRSCPGAGAQPSTAFLTLPTSCTGEHASTMRAESWPVGPDRPGTTVEAQPTKLALGGCEALSFAPTLAIEPEEHAASTPSGLNARVEMPQPGLLSEEGDAESAVRETTVTLPEGMLLSPSAANGLGVCEPTLAGFIEGVGGLEAQLAEQRFTPTLPTPEQLRPGVNICPDSAKVGTVAIRTPLLPHELHGGAYLGSQDTAPFGTPLVLYLIAQDPVSGVVVKLAGEVRVSETGQLTTTFKNTPQLPFQTLTLHFFGGSSASLSTPPRCGSQTTHATFAGWSGASATRAPSFTTETGPGGGPCPPSPPPFAPSFQAGSASSQAGAFTPFTLNIGHADGNQPLSTLTMHLPPGVAAMLASATPCPEPQAAENQCGPESLIGHSVASAGLGSDPVSLPGTVYLTGPYEGAPFGISVVTPAVAGPFNLGDVTVRSKILVDQNTAAVTIASDPFPTFVKGVPAQIKGITVSVDRPNFEFNPTNCDPMAITASLTGAQGASASASSPFQATNCAALPFHPTLTATTKGDSSKANGASFSVRVTSSPGQANIAKTKLVLPIALPARLTTIQKACLAATFEANPAACPEGSNIGSATVHTPVLKNPLSGPAYLVSHGNAAFPDVEFVLQGEGITLILDGQTDIKKGIITSTFNAVPDAPVTVFETTLPEGPHSALAANVPEAKKFSLCGQKLVMPTTITAQNGAVITQQTKIPVTGCGAVKGAKFTRAQMLVRALKKCRKQFKHNKAKRAKCERKARKRYGAKKKAGHKTRRQAKHRKH